MNAKTSGKERSTKSAASKTIFQEGKLHPSISILIPVNKKYPHFKEAQGKMKSLVKEAETVLKNQLSKEMADSVINKLRETVLGVDYTHLSESLAIFVSSEIQKVIHLSVPVEEKMIIGRSFELRDLFLTAKMNFHYWVLCISENKVRVLLGYGNDLRDQEHDQMPYGMYDVPGKGIQECRLSGQIPVQKMFQMKIPTSRI
jgi:hypothetical protein